MFHDSYLDSIFLFHAWDLRSFLEWVQFLSGTVVKCVFFFGGGVGGSGGPFTNSRRVKFIFSILLKDFQKKTAGAIHETPNSPINT